MTKVLSFEEFVATKRYCEDLIEFTSEPGNKGWVYDELCYIQGPMPDGDYFLTIYNAQWVGDLDYLEGILYEEFYIPEVSNAGS